MIYTITKNEQFGSYEIKFDEKPSAETRGALKALKFRWNGARGIWYGYADDEQIIKNALDGNTEQGEQSAEKKPTSKKNTEQKAARPSLWERTRTDGLAAYGTDSAEKKAIHEKARANGWSFDRAAADYFRRHLRERFPEVKFSVTSGGAGYLDACDIVILKSPYGREFVTGDTNAADSREWYDRHENSPELAAILNYCDKLHDSLDADDGDDYADYGAHHDLYGSASISYHYEQTEQTDADRADVEAFRAAKEKAEAEERAAFERQCAEQAERDRIAAIEAAEREKRENAQAAELLENIDTLDLDEENQSAFTNLIGGSGKEASRAELDETIENHDRTPTDAIISRMVVFKRAEDIEFFEKNFLRDWDFLKGKGGTATEDVRFDDPAVDYYKLNAEQRKTVKAHCVDCVAIFYGDELKYIVDPEGYGYARYVYIPTEQTEQQRAGAYKAAERAASSQKPAFYIPAPISEQIEAAELEAGDAITIISVNDMMISVSDTRATFERIEPCKYAQYENAARIVFKLPRKRGLYQMYIIPSSEFILYRGDLPAIPDALKYEPTNSPSLQRLRAAGMGYKEYLKDVINYYALAGYKPIIDTYQR